MITLDTIQRARDVVICAVCERPVDAVATTHRSARVLFVTVSCHGEWDGFEVSEQTLMDYDRGRLVEKLSTSAFREHVDRYRADDPVPCDVCGARYGDACGCGAVA